MSVDRSDPRLTAYAFDELSLTEKAELEAELASDEAAAKELAEIRQTLKFLQTELTRTAPPKLEPPRRQEIEQLARAPRRKRMRRLLWGTVSAGALVASALLFSTSKRSESLAWEVIDTPGVPAASAPSSAPETIELAPSFAPEADPEPPAPAPLAERHTVTGMGPLRGLVGVAPARPSRALRDPGFESDYRQAAPAVPKSTPATAPPAAVQGVKAGEWDDNANYREFMRWLGTRPAPAHYVNLRDRRFIVVRDVQGLGVPNCRIIIKDESQRQAELTTLASGRALLFPHAEGLTGEELTASTSCGGGAQTHFALSDPEQVVELRLGQARSMPSRNIDIVFILDTTGSMSEEIDAVKATVGKVAGALRDSQVGIRLGMVDYKDRGDVYVTRILQLSDDLPGFSQQVSGLKAGGGGDTPESVNQALHVAVNQLSWNTGAFARLAFLIGDAPPHLDYASDYDYVLEAREAAHRGIQLFTVAASGMDTLGQVVWRQVAAYTGATNLFVLRGGAGPQSTGAGDPKSSCGGTQTAYTSGNLDALMLAKINGAIHALDRDPLRIAGLLMDENAKPCAERVWSE